MFFGVSGEEDHARMITNSGHSLCSQLPTCLENSQISYEFKKTSRADSNHFCLDRLNSAASSFSIGLPKLTKTAAIGEFPVFLGVACPTGSNYSAFPSG